MDDTNQNTTTPIQTRRRRLKRDRKALTPPPSISSSPPPRTTTRTTPRPRKIKKDEKTIHDHILTILPSLLGLAVAALALAAKMGFRGRPTVAGIDLGTTNSVICIQSPAKSVGDITCIPDPVTNSPVIPSVVSFVDVPRQDMARGGVVLSSVGVAAPLVGHAAKARIDSFPHSTVYHAKRIIGRRFEDEAVEELRREVGFDVVQNETTTEQHQEALFRVSVSQPSSTSSSSSSAGLPSASASSSITHDTFLISPTAIGTAVLTHLLTLTSRYLGHSSVTSAVIAVPAEFSPSQRAATLRAYANAGIKVIRVLEEPTAAALAYGLDQKEGVEHVLVYDFGGGTLDVSLLRMGKDGYVDVMGSAGDGNLGGVDFDVAVAHWLMEKEGSQQGLNMEGVIGVLKEGIDEDDLVAFCQTKIDDHVKERGFEKMSLCTSSAFHTAAERMKIRLSNEPDINVVEETCLTFSDEFTSMVLKTDNMETFSDLETACQHLTTYTLSLTRDEFNTVAQPLFDKATEPIRRVLNDLDMTTADIDEVVMVGGTTRMPQIRELVKKEVGVERLNVDIDPDLTVAYGAASVID